jgi:hypothetical protein
MSFDIAKRISYLTTLIEQKRSDLPDFPEKFRILKIYPDFCGFLRISEKIPEFAGF